MFAKTRRVHREFRHRIAELSQEERTVYDLLPPSGLVTYTSLFLRIRMRSEKNGIAVADISPIVEALEKKFLIAGVADLRAPAYGYRKMTVREFGVTFLEAQEAGIGLAIAMDSV